MSSAISFHTRGEERRAAWTSGQETQIRAVSLSGTARWHGASAAQPPSGGQIPSTPPRLLPARSSLYPRCRLRRFRLTAPIAKSSVLRGIPGSKAVCPWHNAEIFAELLTSNSQLGFSRFLMYQPHSHRTRAAAQYGARPTYHRYTHARVFLLRPLRIFCVLCGKRPTSGSVDRKRRHGIAKFAKQCQACKLSPICAE
jgi:hypothetical protein